MPPNDISAFIALWDKNVGAKVVDFIPKPIKYDFELITMQIFIAFQNFYSGKDDINKKISRTFFKLPLKNINRKASIFLDSIESPGNEDKTQPFVVAFLFPGYVSDADIKDFDNFILKIGSEYVSTQKSLLEKYFNKILELFLLKEKVEDAEISIENYTFETALLDFKTGMEQFTKKNFRQAYIFLKKAHMKFKAEHNVKLELETAFFLGSVLSQLNKIKAAQEYYETLEELSNQLQHQKYYETALFMGGFCAFKTGDYENALDKFKKLESEDIQFIDKFQFYFLYGRVFRLVGQIDNAVEVLERAEEMETLTKESEEAKEKHAKL